MARYLKVGVAQFASAIGDVDANLKAHLSWIAEGRAAGLDLLVMPEVSLTGHFGVETLLASAIRRSDPRLSQLAEAAGDMPVVVGFIEEGRGAQFYNASAVLRNGQLAYLHRKVNLPSYGRLEEGKHYAAGRFVDNCVLDDDWAAGLLICADVWNPSLTHLAFLHGASLLICPVSSGVEAVGIDFDNPGGWALTMRFYAMMYGAPAIMANRVGIERDLTFWGGSRIVDAFGREVAVAGAGEEMITAELDFHDVRRARHLLPTVRDSNIGLVHREMTRLIETLGVPEFVRGDSK
ncbi:nitrilase-related carbon-nitrogen hydrolase [Pararhodobacter sp. SW119]|uniref:nitrilase-related carbon-nitrogen hydrolase n=1 Tax=Pararhodobacter sp. SW119 TaxID=2780075 RepID=UPI001ADF95A5|nr:nitrilase-related carbon-nitrogen hydrolase [Pararhodobacter sp. SW119]